MLYACLFSFIENTASHIISCRLWKHWLQLYCLFIAFFRHSFGSYFSHTSQHIKTRLGLWLVQVAQRLTRFRKLKFIGLNVRRRLLYIVKSHCTFASQYLASQHLYWLELTDIKAVLTSKWDMLGIAKNSQKLKRLYCTCIVLALLERHLNSFYSHPVFAFF